MKWPPPPLGRVVFQIDLEVKGDTRGFFEESEREYCGCELPEQPSSRSVTERFSLLA